MGHNFFPLSREREAPSELTRSRESPQRVTRESAMDGLAHTQPKRLTRRALLFLTRRDGAEAQTSRHIKAAESATPDHVLLSRRSLLAGLALAGAFGLGILRDVAPGRPIAQGAPPVGVAPWANASTMIITPIWQGEPSEYQNRQEWQREHEHTCSPTAIATVLNAWQNLLDGTGRPAVHIRDVLHEAMRQRAYLSGAGTYWIGSIAPIGARFGFRTIWGYDATSYLAYGAAVFDTMAGHTLFQVLEDLIFGPSAPWLMCMLKEQARTLFLSETQNKARRQVPLELVQHIATRGFPILVDLWSPQMPQGHMVTVYGGEQGRVFYVDPGSGSYEEVQTETFRKVWVRDFAILYPRQVPFPRDLWQTLQGYRSVYAD